MADTRPSQAYDAALARETESIAGAVEHIHPEVASLPQERDPDDVESPQREIMQQQRLNQAEANGKWSPLTTFWNEMGEDKPPSKRRKVGLGQTEEEFDELEEEEPSGVPAPYDGAKARAKCNEGSQSSAVDGDSSTTLNGGTMPAKRECTRCVRSGTPCVVGTGASCLRCRAMHQSCSLVTGRSTTDKTDAGLKAAKQERSGSTGVSLRRRISGNSHENDLLDDVLNIHDTLNGISNPIRKRRRSDDLPTTVASRSQTPDSPTGRARSHSPDLDEIIELAAGSAGQLGPSGSTVLPRTRKRTQKTLRKLGTDNGRLNGDDFPAHRSRAHHGQHPPSRVMKALLMTSRAGRLYSEAIEELSLFVEEQRYL